MSYKCICPLHNSAFFSCQVLHPPAPAAYSQNILLPPSSATVLSYTLPGYMIIPWQMRMADFDSYDGFFSTLVFVYHPEYWPFLLYHIVNRTNTTTFKKMIKVSDLDIWNQSIKITLAIPPTMTSSAKILINSRTNFIKIIYIPLNTLFRFPHYLPPSAKTYFHRPLLAGIIIYPAGVYDNTVADEEL